MNCAPTDLVLSNASSKHRRRSPLIAVSFQFGWNTSASPGNIPTKWLASASAAEIKNNFAKRYLLPRPAHQHTADYYDCNYICVYDEDARTVTGHAGVRLGADVLVVQSPRAARRCGASDRALYLAWRGREGEHSRVCTCDQPLSHVHT